ncbi:MAG: Uncharacterized protein CEN87_123 [Parcubacteria group bacterium Licking1014_1]|nr:MAG: Uncharacterized protein CEN87_123 [Parcubacteria group bacterium Licking1014_1]
MTIKETAKKIIPKFLINIYHYKLSLLGAVIFGFSGKNKNLKIIGVTGTSGKSTTVDFIARILEEPFDSAQGRSGHKVASLSSIRFKLGEKEWENKHKMTMPGRFVIQKFLKQAKKAGCEYVVLEVTSEGIRQFRHKFINFNTAVFTNLSPEHIESHGSFEKYRNEKLKLFRAAKNIHIVNLDDGNAKYFLEMPAKEKWAYSIKIFNEFSNSTGRPQSGLPVGSAFQTICAKNIKTTSDGISFSIGGADFKLNLLGEFNVYNVLASVCVGLSQGISLAFCKKALEKIKTIPGRMEIITRNPFSVVVDYAHTPEQLDSVYRALTHQLINSLTHKLICVLGSCGGGRDKWKRPVLGKIAGKYCKEIIITNEDPYDENPSQILSEIKSGISNFHLTPAGGFPVGFFPISNFYEILDRKEAIKKALRLAKPNDVVIITGKGAEPWMCVANGRKIPWDDRKIAREALTDI